MQGDTDRTNDEGVALDCNTSKSLTHAESYPAQVHIWRSYYTSNLIWPTRRSSKSCAPWCDFIPLPSKPLLCYFVRGSGLAVSFPVAAGLLKTPRLLENWARPGNPHCLCQAHLLVWTAAVIAIVMPHGFYNATLGRTSASVSFSAAFAPPAPEEKKKRRMAIERERELKGKTWRTDTRFSRICFLRADFRDCGWISCPLDL